MNKDYYRPVLGDSIFHPRSYREALHFLRYFNGFDEAITIGQWEYDPAYGWLQRIYTASQHHSHIPKRVGMIVDMKREGVAIDGTPNRT